LKNELVEQGERLQAECRNHVAAARQQDQETIRALRLRYESSQQTATAKERDNLRVMKTMETSHLHAADHLEQVYDKRIQEEQDRYVALQVQLRHLEDQLTKMRETAQQDQEHQRQLQEEQLQHLLGEKDAELQKLKDLYAFTQHRFDAMLDQESLEHDLEVQDLQRRCQEDLEQQRLAEYKLKKEQDTLLRGLDMMERDRQRIMKEQQESEKNINILKAEAESMQRNVATIKAERKEREATLRDKELEVSAHKVKVNTLTKFKHVLDYRLREVTLSLQPKDQMIEQLNAHLLELETEFERQLEVQKQMENALELKKEQINVLSAEGDSLRETVKQQERTIHRFSADLHKLVTEEKNVRRWPGGIRQIYQKHADHEHIIKAGENEAAQELKRQIQIVQRKATSLKVKGNNTDITCKADIMQKTHENSLIINELDELRVENKTLQRQSKDLELRVRQMEQRAAEQRALAPAQALTTAPSPGWDGGSSGMPTNAKDKREASVAVADLFSDRVRKQQPETSTPTVMPVSAAPSLGITGNLRKTSGASHLCPDERKHMQKLLAVADLNNQQIQMQRLEHKLLQDQLERLMQEKQRTVTSDGDNAVGIMAGKTHGVAAL